MDDVQASALIAAERATVQQLLSDNVDAGQQDRLAEQEQGDSTDLAQSLTAEGVDDAIAAGLRERLAALDRAAARIAAGTYGRSLLSGEPIPDARLEADPAAEYTVDEARAQR
jgi:DnaK suppressor protein